MISLGQTFNWLFWGESADGPVWLMGSSNLSFLPKSSQQMDRSSRPITFTKSPVEKDTSQPEISYIDPDPENKKKWIMKRASKLPQLAGLNLEYSTLSPLERHNLT